MKRKIFTLLALAVIAVGTASAAAKTITINKVSTAPEIDGTLEEVWEAQAANALDQTKGTNGEGFSAEFKMCYDATNFYVAVSVTDPTEKIDGASTWQSDCVELFLIFDTDTADRPTAYTSGTNRGFQLRKVASKSQADGGLEGAGVLTTDVVEVAQEDGGTYVQEWSIPLELAASIYPKSDTTPGWDGKMIMFDVQAAQANTTETGREFQAFWNSSADNQYNNVQNQGYVFLAEPIQVAVKSTPASKASAYVVGSVLKVKGVNGIVNVYDLTGKMVAKSTVNGSADINISALKAGMYIVSGNGLSAKIVK